ncbi:MAG: hypothetical protein WD359_03570 [Dehalococcoidia bacterium]
MQRTSSRGPPARIAVILSEREDAVVQRAYRINAYRAYCSRPIAGHTL